MTKNNKRNLLKLLDHKTQTQKHNPLISLKFIFVPRFSKSAVDAGLRVPLSGTSKNRVGQGVGQNGTKGCKCTNRAIGVGQNMGQNGHRLCPMGQTL